MSAFEFLFYGISALAILSAIGVISAKNPIYSALSLVVTLFSLAGLFILLKAEFLAIIQVLTYAGAILVLFVFIIMLLNLSPEELEERGYGNLAKALLATSSLGLFLILGYAFRVPRWEVPPLPEGFGSAAVVGREIFTQYLIPFEIAGLLLTVA